MTKKYDLNGINENIEFGKDGVRLKNNLGVFEHRNSIDSDYVIVRGNTPLDDNDLTTKLFVDTTIGTIVIDISDLQDAVSNLQTDVGNLQTDVTTLQTDVGTNQTDIGNLQTDVTTLQTDVGTNQTDIGNLQTDVSDLQDDVSDLQSAISGLFKRVEVSTTLYTVTEGNILLGVTIYPCVIIIPTSFITAIGDPKWIIKDETGLISRKEPITIETEGSETIDGKPNAKLYLKYSSFGLYTNGSNLFIYN